MECFQKGPKATVGRVQGLEAPQGGSRASLALLGTLQLVSTTSCEDQPSGLWGQDPVLRCPQGIHSEAWEAGWPAFIPAKLGRHLTPPLLEPASQVLDSPETLQMPTKVCLKLGSQTELWTLSLAPRLLPGHPHSCSDTGSPLTESRATWLIDRQTMGRSLNHGGQEATLSGV